MVATQKAEMLNPKAETLNSKAETLKPRPFCLHFTSSVVKTPRLCILYLYLYLYMCIFIYIYIYIYTVDVCTYVIYIDDICMYIQPSQSSIHPMKSANYLHDLARTF